MEDEGKWIVSEFYDSPHKMTINNWDKSDRPREKMMEKGASALTNAELLAILIGSGNAKESAVDLMRRVMFNCNDSLKALGQKTVEDLTSYNGIGDAKAITILAGCELGKRRQNEEVRERLDLSNAQSIYEYMRPKMQDLTTEEGWILLLNHNFRLIGEAIRISQGGLTETAIDVRLVVKHAIMNNATVVVLAHNHPSNNPHPSREDDRVTNQVKEALKLMRLHLADHVIVCDGDYYSYNENGKL